MKQKIFNWTDTHQQSFDLLKNKLCEATELFFPVPGVPLSVTTDASKVAVGACLHQTVNGESQPLAFFSRSMSDCETRYSTFDRELLAVFAAIKKWKHYLSGSVVSVFTDHKPLVGALKNHKERDSDRQSRQISFILEYISDVIFISGKSNIVADTLSRPVADILSVDSSKINPLIDLVSIAKEQNLVSKPNNLTSVKINDLNLFCDTSSANPRPFIPETLRRNIFESLHNLAHPGWKATCRLIGSRYYWLSLKSDVKRWCEECVRCQACKIGRHVCRPLVKLPMPSQRFTNIHIDIFGPLEQSSGGYNTPRYLITMVDAYTRWLEAIPVSEITAEVVCKTFLFHWVSRFGPPLYIISDKGTQFNSELLTNFTKFLGIHQIRTSSYNPKANGMVERAHRTLKAALRSRADDWLEQLPYVLLGLRMRPDSDGSSAYSRVTGEHPFMPQIFTDSILEEDLSKLLNKVVFPYNIPRSRDVKQYLPEKLKTCDFVWVRLDRVRRPMEAPYQGPFEVLDRAPNYFSLSIRGKNVNVAIECLKPANFSRNNENQSIPVQVTDKAVVRTPDIEDRVVQTRRGRTVRFNQKNSYHYF